MKRLCLQWQAYAVFVSFVEEGEFVLIFGFMCIYVLAVQVFVVMVKQYFYICTHESKNHYRQYYHMLKPQDYNS